MLKHKKRVIDPKRLNKYNKFLCTLDNLSNNNFINKNVNYLQQIINEEKVNEEKVNEENINTEIDKIIKNINKNYTSQWSSSNFNGINNTDSLYINYNDPNYYEDNNQSNILHSYKQNLKCINKKEQPLVEITQIINIDTEINNISDILSLIEKYKVDSSIKYNINIKTLHEIKEPLIELNNI